MVYCTHIDIVVAVRQLVSSFNSRYWKRDEWDDGLEKAIAFGLIASHRLEQLNPPVEFGGESLPFVIRLNM